MLSYWHRQRGLAALHIKQEAGRSLSDWKTWVKWSTAAVSVSSTVLPPDWFSWSHPPLHSSSPQPKPSLLSLKWIASPENQTNKFSQHQIFPCSKKHCPPMYSWWIWLLRCKKNTFPSVHSIRNLHLNWHFGLMNGHRYLWQHHIQFILQADSYCDVSFN